MNSREVYGCFDIVICQLKLLMPHLNVFISRYWMSKAVLITSQQLSYASPNSQRAKVFGSNSQLIKSQSTAIPGALWVILMPTSWQMKKSEDLKKEIIPEIFLRSEFSIVI